MLCGNSAQDLEASENVFTTIGVRVQCSGVWCGNSASGLNVSNNAPFHYEGIEGGCGVRIRFTVWFSFWGCVVGIGLKAWKPPKMIPH